MSLDLSSIQPLAKRPPKKPRRLGFRLGVVAAIVVVTLGLAKAWDAGYRPAQVWEGRPVGLATVDVDRGDLVVLVNETGTCESAANTTVRCQVEALIGMVGGAATAKSQGAGMTAGGPAQAGAVVAPTMTLTVNAPAATSKTAASAKSKTAGAAKKATTTSAKGGTTGGSSTGSGSGGSGGSSGGGGMGGGGSSGGGGGGSAGASSSGGIQAPVAQRPTIRSFTTTVAPYASLRPATKGGAPAQPKAAGGGMSGGGRSGGGGGGGNRSNSAGTPGQQEMAGSTRIIMIKPEGTEVSTGEVVCELDSAAYKDELIAQTIRYDQAKAWVVQARSILEVNEISLREYRDGIYRQDLQLIRQYLSSCRTEEDRATRNLAWSKEVYEKGYRAPAQYQADVLARERAVIALGEAERMEARLLNFTGPKLIKSLEAKLEANKADALAQEAAFQLESDRLKRLKKTVEACTLRAPHEGIVVYSMPPARGWRAPTAVIMEGATVREGQAIFDLPDARKMRVRARINESKVGSVWVGQKTSIRIDAFPDRPLIGTVTEVTLIPAPNGMGSDIRIYFANVTIDSGGFDGLRPGLSAEVSFLVNSRPDTIRVPLQSIRWIGETPYAAVTTTPDRTRWRWQPLEIGLMNEFYGEVLKGLNAGDKVVADPIALANPPEPTVQVFRADENSARTTGG